MPQKQVLHRDLKPENVLLQEEGAVITDFETAKQMGGGPGSAMTVTTTGVAGTMGYMAQEVSAFGPPLAVQLVLPIVMHPLFAHNFALFAMECCRIRCTADSPRVPPPTCLPLVSCWVNC